MAEDGPGSWRPSHGDEVVDAIRRAGVVLLPVHLDVARRTSRRQARLVAAHAALDAKYREDKKTYYFYDKTGRAYRIYNPRGLPPAHAYLPLTEWSSRSNLLQHAQRRYSATIHHSAWREMHAAAGRAGRREQRRFGLHLSMMTDVMADGIYSQHDLPLNALGDLLRGKLGRGAVEHELHCEHSTTRTDLYIYQGVNGDLPCIGDTKIFAGVPSDPSGVGRMGAFVACAEGKCRVEALLFEEFGAMSAGVVGARMDAVCAAAAVGAAGEC
ncbi:hypothetical protein EMIHUDRAFT_196220 [Emiliania huxleyi CCMP1516]|uniref:Uncharacterized protein n=2 Tax=Emiliania huxleyi TaxID=2903 RepID=A0A0D3J3P3_EMIH1|nr:hypothetical protein EMIHUDRAFT_196220 [Emiliania huxleyi CCMP1516]EOD18128.1 hypothetical protein EMIHUDRAFT_196220 [Emiliania huxleyi CCMP1516]|eukprot:XP_005770557.1 hypothetical protein EMIHUDRAFT_196220 [Emiliania huxleyi CCMP1516]